MAEWLISIETVRSWFTFGKKDSKFMLKLCEEIDKVLQSEREITSVGWQD
jgi:hypothetical protein